MPRPAPDRVPTELTNRTIFAFWAPLAATWLMMAAEGPFLAAVVARLPNPVIGLAAFGVGIAFAVLIESPVLMLLSAATALVEDGDSYRRMRTFANGLNALATGLLLIILVPAVHEPLFRGLLALPEDVTRQAVAALWCFIPWPAAIGIRRFLQGVMIRSGETRLVAYGTVIRLAAMATAALTLATLAVLPGAAVGAAALSSGVVAEAVAARIMAHGSIRALLAGAAAGNEPSISYREIARFYYPLALTALIGLAVQPLLTFFMGRAASPVESLAVFPVVHSLGFIFRSLGLSFQDAVIALIGRGRDGYPELARFAVVMGSGATLVLAAIAFTPLSSLWFETISGLTPELASFAIPAARLLTPIPLLGVWLSLQRGVLMKGRRTGPITWASGAEVATIAVVFVIGARAAGMVGVTAAFTALLAGRAAANAFLLPRTRRMLDAPPPVAATREDPAS